MLLLQFAVGHLQSKDSARSRRLRHFSIGCLYLWRRYVCKYFIGVLQLVAVVFFSADLTHYVLYGKITLYEYYASTNLHVLTWPTINTSPPSDSELYPYSIYHELSDCMLPSSVAESDGDKLSKCHNL